MNSVTVYSVLDGNGYRRLETLSENESLFFLNAMKKKGDALAEIVETVRAPNDWTKAAQRAA